jgi:membrane-associated protease RseP (regulator of RpoE activity)
MVSYKIWILIIALICAFLAIAPWGYFEKGAEIKSIVKNSSEALSGLSSGMIITELNGNTINSASDYSKYISELFGDSNGSEQKLTITADSKTYIFLTSEAPSMVVSEIPKTKLKTGLDLSGGARALIKPSNITLSDSELNDLI